MLDLLLALVALAPPRQDLAGNAAPAAPRPRIGLVLSSGGAHTLAQVGALAALEELRIPVDFVAGSEGGALVGGLYSAGLSASEIRDFLQNRLSLDALSGRVPRTLLSWRQRTVDRDFLMALPVSFGPGHMGLARGLARTRWISWLLSNATLRVAGAERFDELPIPFRAVATDLLAGEVRVLDSGDLPGAILASMATPGLYAPVEIGGRELGSGALLDPIPVDAALAANCDVLLVVDCALELAQPERLASFLSAAAHMRVLAGESSRRAALARLRPGDFVIAPDPAGADEEDFRSAHGVYERGHGAVMARAPELARLALDPTDWERHLAERRARQPELPVLGAVHFEDRSGLDEAVLRARVESEPGERLDATQISEDLLRLYGLDYHERVDVALEPRDDGRADLRIRTHDSDDDLWNPRAGVALEGVFGEDATYALGAAFTFRPIGGRGAEWRNRIEVGSRILVFSEFWQPIDRAARWFVAPAIAYEQERVNVTINEDVVAALDVWALGGRLDVGRVLGEWGEARVGIVQQTGHIGLAVGTPGLIDGEDFDQGFAEGSVTIDTVDSLALPREGTIGRVVVTSPVDVLGGEQQSYLQAQIDHAMTWDRTTLVLGGEFDSALDDEQALQNAFPLGGFLRLSGLGRDSVSGAHVGLARAVSWVELGSRGLDRRLVGWNVGASVEAGQTWGARDDIELADLRLSGSVFLAAQTPFGPVFLGAGATEPGETAVFLLFGNLFGNWDPF
ncbi:MAG: patatin-like phospholipase family protein [Planctomycetota bacterium]|nr:patatin-like phospholipase family protein [Planctomycetota bacterium]